MRNYPGRGGSHSVIRYCLLMLTVIMFSFCSSSKKALAPNRKYPAEQLQKDYTLFREILEESHPSLYWFTPKDSMDYYFDWGYKQINDSMNERDFRMVLTYVIEKVLTVIYAELSEESI